MSAPLFRPSRLVAIGVAAAAGLLLLLGFEYGTALLSTEPAMPRRAPAASSTGPPRALTLSMFDKPRPVPETRFQDDQDHDLTLADFRGRVILLNVWATWCIPCRQEMATLDRLQARLGGKDFLVIALSIDRNGVQAVRDFYREVGIEKLAIYVDPSGKGSQGLAIPGVPTTLLIDREGREIARKMGAAEWDGPEMVSLIKWTMSGESARNAGQAR